MCFVFVGEICCEVDEFECFKNYTITTSLFLIQIYALFSP